MSTAKVTLHNSGFKEGTQRMSSQLKKRLHHGLRETAPKPRGTAGDGPTARSELNKTSIGFRSSTNPVITVPSASTNPSVIPVYREILPPSTIKFLGGRDNVVIWDSNVLNPDPRLALGMGLWMLDFGSTIVQLTQLPSFVVQWCSGAQPVPQQIHIAENSNNLVRPSGNTVTKSHQLGPQHGGLLSCISSNDHGQCMQVPLVTLRASAMTVGSWRTSDTCHGKCHGRRL
ncbi:hypothetical protein B0H14DRAFT_2577203 [Mycena olivaceomarginata]|nr:hypothetical protein B0H14DRAFT_2577203 [Mycena olivaceomarginata]